jgi:hypothetical protein
LASFPEQPWLQLSKGEAGFDRGRVVFLYNLLAPGAARTISDDDHIRLNLRWLLFSGLS